MRGSSAVLTVSIVLLLAVTPSPAAAQRCTPITYVGVPASYSVSYGSTTTITSTISATASTPVYYQWYEQIGERMQAISGATSPSYTMSNVTAARTVYVMAWNACTTLVPARSNYVTVTPVCTLAITSHPQSQTIASGSTATLSIATSGSTPVTFQWYRGRRGDTLNPVGTNSSQYQTPPLTETTYYWATAKACWKSVDSYEAEIRIACSRPVVSAQPQSQTVVAGSSATLSVTATGTAPLKYEWYRGVKGDRSTPVGADSPTFITPALAESTRFWVLVSNACGLVESSEATITVTPVCAGPVITVQPQSVATTTGQQFQFSVTATGTAPLSYQWYAGVAGDESRPIAGAVAPAYSGTASATMMFWVKVWNSCGSVSSNAASLSVGCGTPAAPQVWVDPIAESGSKYIVRFESTLGAVRFKISEAKVASLTLPPGFVWPPFRDLPAGENEAIFEHVNAEEKAVYYYYAIRAVCDETHISPPAIAYVGVLPEKRPVQIDSALPSEGSVAYGTALPLQVAKLLIMPPTAKSALDTSFTVTTGAPWLTATPSNGTIPANGVVVEVTANPATLPVGSSTTGVVVATGTSAPKSTTASVNLLTPVTTVPKTTPPPNAMIIPAVGHAEGAAGSMFQSDVRIANTASTRIRYALTYTPTAVDGTAYGRQTEIEIGAGQTVAVNDILKNWYCIGLLGESGQGALEIRPLNFSGKVGDASVSELATVVSSRTYNVTATGTYGQFIPAIPFQQFVGKSAVLSLQQVAQSAAYRTNVGFVEGSGEPAEIEIRLVSGNGTSLATVTRWLAAAEQRQFSLAELFKFDGQLADGRVEVRVLSESGRVSAYASVVDNVTSDPLLVSPVDITTLQASRYVIPGVGHVDTGAAQWRSDLRVFNAADSPVNATLLFFPQNSTAPVVSKQLTIAAKEVKAFDNVSETYFGLKNINGVVHVITGTPSALVVSARTYDQRPSGTYGQFIPGVTPEQSAGVADRALQLLQIEQSERFRSHLGIAETTGNPATIEITALIPETTVVPKVQIPLGANEFRQLPNIISMLNLPTTYNGRIEVKVIGGTGRVTAYASVVDNRTQDPTYIPAQ